MNDLFELRHRDSLRKIGGLLIGLAAAMIYIRKGPFLTVNRISGPHSRCSSSRDPAVYLYGAS